jgi:hypothetical protein
LEQAALLHDVGKRDARFSVFDRSLTVLLKAASPSLLQLWLRLRPGLASRYRIYVDHARIGAELVGAAGGSELAAVIAEHHDAKPKHSVTRDLQRADGRN